MRILHTADWHLGKTLEGRSRLDEQAQFLDELYQIVKDEHIDVIVMAGDAFDTVNPPARAEQLFMKVYPPYLIKENVRSWSSQATMIIRIDYLPHLL